MKITAGCFGYTWIVYRDEISDYQKDQTTTCSFAGIVSWSWQYISQYERNGNLPSEGETATLKMMKIHPWHPAWKWHHLPNKTPWSWLAAKGGNRAQWQTFGDWFWSAMAVKQIEMVKNFEKWLNFWLPLCRLGYFLITKHESWISWWVSDWTLISMWKLDQLNYQIYILNTSMGLFWTLVLSSSQAAWRQFVSGFRGLEYDGEPPAGSNKNQTCGCCFLGRVFRINKSQTKSVVDVFLIRFVERVFD